MASCEAGKGSCPACPHAVLFTRTPRPGIDRVSQLIYDARMAVYEQPKARREMHGAGAAGFRKTAQSLSQISREFYQRGWALGTSGNFSTVASREPLRLAITQSGVDKGNITLSQIVMVDAAGKAVHSRARPSDEVLLHLALVNSRGAGAVLHTHSIWSTIASEAHARDRGLRIEGYEMLKGLDGVYSHASSEWLPILENSQDMPALARAIEDTAERHPKSHGILLRRHGLYTWGNDLASAKRHLEVLEFLLQTTVILDFRFWILDWDKERSKYPMLKSKQANPKSKI